MSLKSGKGKKVDKNLSGDPPGQVELFPDHEGAGLFDKVRERASKVSSLMSVTTSEQEDELDKLFVPKPKSKKVKKAFPKTQTPARRNRGHLSHEGQVLQDKADKKIRSEKTKILSEESNHISEFVEQLTTELKHKKKDLIEKTKQKISAMKAESKQRVQDKIEKKLEEAEIVYEKMKASAKEKVLKARAELTQSEDNQIREYVQQLNSENENKIKNYTETLIGQEKEAARGRIKKRLLQADREKEQRLDELYLAAKRDSEARIERFQKAECEREKRRIDAERDQMFVDVQQKILSCLEKEESLISSMRNHQMTESEKEAYDRIQNKIKAP